MWERGKENFYIPVVAVFLGKGFYLLSFKHTFKDRLLKCALRMAAFEDRWEASDATCSSLVMDALWFPLLSEMLLLLYGRNSRCWLSDIWLKVWMDHLHIHKDLGGRTCWGSNHRSNAIIDSLRLEHSWWGHSPPHTPYSNYCTHETYENMELLLKHIMVHQINWNNWRSKSSSQLLGMQA